MSGALGRAIQNFGFLTGAQITVRLLHFGLLAAIARMAGKEAVGGYATAISVGTTCLGKGSERSGWRSCRPCGSNARIAWFKLTCLTIANGRGARERGDARLAESAASERVLN